MNRRFFLKLLGLGTAAAAVPSVSLPAATAIRPAVITGPNEVIEAKLAAAKAGWICSGWINFDSPRQPRPRRDARGRFARRSTDTNGTE